MISFKLKSWNAIAPGIESYDDWLQWLNHPAEIPSTLPKLPLKTIPPILRRRFTELGRCAAGAALPLLDVTDAVPGVFASRHGDTPLTLSLLEGIADGEDMSPTGFSLAVHNAVSGLLSIARKDVSEVTAIAATDLLFPMALLEASTQLQDSNEVLCVIYDVPLPELYQPYASFVPFPFAIALLLSRTEGDEVVMTLEKTSDCGSANVSNHLEDTLRFLTGLNHFASFRSHDESSVWRMTSP